MFLNPKYTLTLPPRQIRNGLYDAMTHCIDGFLTGQVAPLNDNFIMSIMRELVDVSKNIFEQPPKIEYYERLIVAASFALNGTITLGKEYCLGIHTITVRHLLWLQHLSSGTSRRQDAISWQGLLRGSSMSAMAQMKRRQTSSSRSSRNGSSRSAT